MNMLAVGAYLRALRSQQGLSQGKLAELVGVAGNTIWRIEAGEQEPRAGQLAALLTALHGRIEATPELRPIVQWLFDLDLNDRAAVMTFVEILQRRRAEQDRTLS